MGDCMMMDDHSKLKDKILQELLDDLDGAEQDKMKPKAMGISVTAVKPKEEEMAMMGGDEGDEMGGDKSDMSEDDLKELMRHYISQKMG